MNFAAIFRIILRTNALVNAGIMSADGKILKKEIRGGEIVFGEDGTPTGFLKDKMFPVDVAKEVLVEIQRM